MAISEVVARLSVVLGMDTAAFSSGSARAKKDMTGLERHVKRASGVVTAAVTTMLGAFTFDAILQAGRAGLEYASSLQEVASQLGVTTKALQEYRYAASQAGIEQSEMDKSLAQLTRRLGDAAQGAKEPAKALERLGIDVRDANGHVLDAGEAIPLIAEGLKNIESPAERAAILVDLFGKSGQRLAPLLEGGAAGVNDLRDAAQKLGVVLSDEQIQKADETADKLAAMKQVLEAKIAGAVADNADSILELANALIKLVDAAGKAARAWRFFTKLDWSPGAGSFSEQFERIQMEELGPGVELTDSVKAAIARRRAAPFLAPSGGALLTAPKRAPVRPPVSPWGLPISTNLNRRNAIGGGAFGGQDWSRFTPGAGAAGILAAATGNAAALATEMERVAANNNDARKSLAEMAQQHGPRLLAALKKISPELAELRAQTQGLLDRLFPDEAEARTYREEQQLLSTALKTGQINAEDYARAIEALRHEYTGLTAAIPEAVQIVAIGTGATIDEVNARIVDGAADALSATRDSADATKVQVVKSFGDMADGAIGALSRLQSAVRSGGFLDILSGVLNLGLQLGSIGVFGKSFAARINSAPKIGANANGTSFWRGGLTMVGERGPELVNLPRGASVTPNSRLDGMGARVEIVPSRYFDAVVDGRIVRASPAIMDGSARVTASRAVRRQMRRLA